MNTTWERLLPSYRCWIPTTSSGRRHKRPKISISRVHRHGIRRVSWRGSYLSIWLLLLHSELLGVHILLKHHLVVLLLLQNLSEHLLLFEVQLLQLLELLLIRLGRVLSIILTLLVLHIRAVLELPNRFVHG